MNLNLPKKPKMNVKSVVIYTISAIVCIIAITIVGLSIYYGSEELDRLITIGGSSVTPSDEEYQLLVANFDNLFQNKVEIDSTDVNIEKVNEEQDVIYTYYSKDESKENYYDINVNIPYINMNDEIIQQYNEEIKKTYEKKVENILQTQSKNTIYTLQYEATIENDILSLIIRANLKEGTSAQRLIIQTFNYDLKNHKQITLEELITLKGLNVNDVQNKINQEIRIQYQRVEDLKSLGYEIFERNPENEIYKIENSQEFFIKDGKIYIVYAYGNENLTSEMDLVII